MIFSPLGAAFFLLLAVVCSKLLTRIKQYRFSRQNGCEIEPRYPQKQLFNGFDLSYQLFKWAQSNTFLQNYSRVISETGKTMTIRTTGARKLKTIDPENVKHILASKTSEFDKGILLGNALRPALGDGILGASGPVWAKGRALIRPAFSRKQITNLESQEEHFQEFVARIPKDGSTVDLKPLFHHYTFDTSSRLLLGASPHTLRLDAPTDALAVEDSFDYAGGEIIGRYIRGPLMFTHRDPKFFGACKTLHKYFDEYIDQAIKISKMPDPKEAWEREMPGTSESFVLLREALEATNDRVWLRDQLMSALVGGRDTTASLMSFVMLFLSRHQQVTQKLREEVDLLKGALPTFETFKDMPYLESVINETLRLYPTVPQIDREAIRDTFLPTGGGPDRKSPIFVPKGQSVQIFVYGMHRDPDIWGPDAHEFRPERWEKLPKAPSGFSPFGSGGHTCPGQQIALLSTSFMTVRLLQTYKRFESRDDRPIVEDLGASLGSKNGVRLGFYSE